MYFRNEFPTWTAGIIASAKILGFVEYALERALNRTLIDDIEPNECARLINLDLASLKPEDEGAGNVASLISGKSFCFRTPSCFCFGWTPKYGSKKAGRGCHHIFKVDLPLGSRRAAQTVLENKEALEAAGWEVMPSRSDLFRRMLESHQIAKIMDQERSA